MIEQLRIKCPSCGVVLEVMNPRHEAVKRITCPQCKRQLAVDFQEKPQPKTAEPASIRPLYLGRQPLQLKEGDNTIFLPGFEPLRIEVVRISDGSLKYMASVLKNEPTVLLNDEPLLEGDKMVMAVGDKLSAASTVLTFGEPAVAAAPQPTPPTPPTPEPPAPTPAPTTPKTPAPAPAPSSQTAPPHTKRNLSPWLGGGMACMVIVVLLWMLWPTKKVEGTMAQPKPKPSTEMVEAPQKKKATEEKKETKPKPTEPQKGNKAEEPKKEPKKESAKELAKEQTDYDLEVLCAQGNTAAMYELGRRWVNTSKHRQGVQYLQQAAAAGHAAAKRLLDNNDW